MGLLRCIKLLTAAVRKLFGGQRDSFDEADVQDYANRCHSALNHMCEELARRSPLLDGEDTAQAVSCAIRAVYLSTELTIAGFPDEAFQAAGDEISKGIDALIDAAFAKHAGGPQ